MPSKYKAGVYKILNTISGKWYVGSSSFCFRRFNQHKTALRGGYHQNKHLQNSWIKYGEDAFKFEMVLFCEPKLIRFYEQLILDKLQPQFNQSKSAYAGIPIGATLTKEHKEKVGKASSKMWEDKEYRSKVTAAINLSMNDEECKKRSQRTKLLWENKEYREKAIASRKGKAYSKGYKCNPEQIENRRKAARISNMKRNYGDVWQQEYIRRYPEHLGDLNA